MPLNTGKASIYDQTESSCQLSLEVVVVAHRIFSVYQALISAPPTLRRAVLKLAPTQPSVAFNYSASLLSDTHG